MDKLKQFSQRLAAGVGLVVIAAASLTTLVPAATAADYTVGNIDADSTGSIIIHKHVTGSQTADGTADGKTVTGGTGVEGVVFTAYKFNDIDLTTNAGWDTVKNLSIPVDACGTDFATPAVSGQTFGTGTAAPATDANGDSTISNLAVGAYLVCETSAPTNVVAKAAPFLVTIPFPNNSKNSASSNDGSWLYNVNVYPKNSIVEAPTKGQVVTNNSIQDGADIDYPVTVKVPQIQTTDSFKYFIVSDPLDSHLSDGKVKSVQIDGVDVPAANYVTTTDGNTVSVGFTSTGLEYLRGQANKSIIVTFTATVNSIPSDGVIPNTAYFYVDTQTGSTPPTPPTTPPDTPPTPTNTVKSSWGDVKIRKVDSDLSDSKVLEGASFQIYPTKTSGNFAATCTIDDIDKEAGPITVGNTNTFTSDSNGIVSIAGLLVDQKIGATGDTNVTLDHTSRCYVLVETAAPAGYTTPTGTAAYTALTVKAGQTAESTVDAEVKNTKSTVPNLPLTGANGRLLLTIAGGALVAFAFGYVLYARNKKNKENA
ncbi:SpaH/EbpB family LPXTG-anchored major pilin [Alloscardovia criceti]|uniref:SpaH/EbpB family LPXTG-anchored major pilin n=1 Tax=Alloscardovia criceti TaxID=356828 RepID=UPI000381ADB4|nr:SpaH/EbpB family LPXTG-anchored major pilin [Alloscardovia criceti]